MNPKVVLLSGGVGGAKMAEGLQGILPPGALTVVANTGDDIELYGLRISPDVDIVTYTLSGCVHTGQGWGVAGDTFRVLERVRELGGEPWFNLGDLDLGVHLLRTQWSREGVGAAEITRRIGEALGLQTRVLPMCESPVHTRLDTDKGDLHLQEYLVRHRAEPVVREIRFEGVDAAIPAPGVLEALAEAEMVILAPSNPLISIGPILAVPGMRQALRSAPGIRVAVSPLVGGVSLKGPTDRMLAQLGHEVSPPGVARLFRDFLDGFVVDERDLADDPSLSHAIADLGMRPVAFPTVMSDRAAKEGLADKVLGWARALPRKEENEANPPQGSIP